MGEIKLGLYSITYGGVWYRGGALTIEQVIERARRFGYQGVEIDGKRPHGNPLDMPAERCRGLRRIAEDEGIEIYAVAANNDFSSPVPEHRESQLLYVRELIRMTAELGANLLRIPGVAGRDPFARRRRALRHREGDLARRACGFHAGADLGLAPRRPD